MDSTRQNMNHSNCTHPPTTNARTQCRDTAHQAGTWPRPASVVDDPISRELKTVAVAVFGQKLAHQTSDGAAVVAGVAVAIANMMWPDQSDEHKALRARFIRMCLNDVVVETSR